MASSQTPPQQTTICVHIFSALTEMLFIFSQLMLGIHLISVSKSTLLPFNSSPLLHILHDTLFFSLLLYSMLLFVAFNLNLSVHALAMRMGLFSIHKISRTPLLIVALHVLGLLVHCLIFTLTREWPFSLHNVWDHSNDRLDIARIFDVVLCTALREELVHRGLLFLAMFRHVNPANYTRSEVGRDAKQSVSALKRCVALGEFVGRRFLARVRVCAGVCGRLWCRCIIRCAWWRRARSGSRLCSMRSTMRFPCLWTARAMM